MGGPVLDEVDRSLRSSLLRLNASVTKQLLPARSCWFMPIKCPSEFFRKPLKFLTQTFSNCACLRRGAWEEMVHCRSRTYSFKTMWLTPKPPPSLSASAICLSLPHTSLRFPESGHVPQPRGRLGDPRCSQNHRWAAETGEEAPGRGLLTRREGKIPAYPEPFLQGRRCPTQWPGAQQGSGPLHPGPLQYSSFRSNTELGRWQGRRRVQGEVQGGQLQPVHQERAAVAQKRKREFKTHGGVTENTAAGPQDRRTSCSGDSVHECLCLCCVCVPVCAWRRRAAVWKQTLSFWTNVSFVVECAASTEVDWVSACVVPPCTDCSPD